MQKPLVLLIHWFGPWPEWIDLFVESCKWNRDVDWLIFTDQDSPENAAPNVRFAKASFDEHKARVCNAIGIDPAPITPHKLCDLRPAFGLVYCPEIVGYRNYGHCDLDLIFGNIRAFYTDALLEKYEVLSTHADRLSGHLAVLRNNEFNRQAFRRIRSWKKKIADPTHFGIDEYPVRQRLRPPLALAPPDRAARTGALRGALHDADDPHAVARWLAQLPDALVLAGWAADR